MNRAGAVTSNFRRRRWRPWLAAIAGLAMALPSPLMAHGAIAPEPPVLRSLRERARAEQSNPGPARTIKPPLELEFLTEPFPDTGGQRDADLEAVLARLKAREPAKVAGEAVDEATLRQSIRLYVRGQTALVEGRFADAVTDLAQAADLNPASPEPWELLASAHARAGRVRDAVGALRRAYDAGSTDPATLMTLWRALRIERRWEDSAVLALRMRTAAAAAEDPGLGVIADAALGESLLSWGAATAGTSLITETIERGRTLVSPRWAEEYAELIRRHADLWTIVGDAYMRLGRVPDALKAYERASTEPGAEAHASDLLQRRVHAMLSSGRAAGAAELIIDDRLSSRASGEHTGELIRAVTTSDAASGATISAALTAIADDPSTTSATRRASLYRAAAAGLGTNGGRELLLSRLERTPDTGMIDDLLTTDRFAPGDSVEGLTLAGNVLARCPASLDQVASLVLRPSPGVDDVLGLRPRVTEPAAGPGVDAVLATLLVRAGRFEEASRLAVAADAKHAADLRWHAWRAKIAAACADWAAGDRAIVTLTASAERDPASGAALLAARALAAMQRPDEALAMYERALANPGTAMPPGVADWLAAADLADWLGRRALSEAHVMRAASLDPEAEGPRLRLLDAAGTSGDPDRERLSSMIRELREVAPDGRGLRLIRARELLRARQFTQALGEYSTLLGDNPDDDDAGAGLLAVFMTMPTTDPGLARLRTRVAELEGAAKTSAWPALAGAALGVRIAKDEASRTTALGAADGVLARVYDADVLRIWSALTREALGPEAGAKRILEKLATYPANADVTGARATAHALLKDIRVASADLDALPAPMGLRPAQAAALMSALEPAAKSAMETLNKPEAPSNEPIRHAIEQTFKRAGRLTPKLHDARLQLMVADREFDMPSLVRATAEAAAQVPDPSAVHTVVALKLARQGMPQASVEFARLAALEEPPGAGALHALWLTVASQIGSAADTIAALRAACEPASFEAVLQEFTGKDTRERSSSITRADLACEFAVKVDSRGLDDAELVYELALEFDPDHALANNNLGYNLLERDRRRDDAVRMIEKAYSRDPNDANVLDSIAWLCYHQGRFVDGPEGEGAVTLLKRAILKDGQNNPTLRDHLGDALYRAGDRDGAGDAWRQASGDATARANRLGGGGAGNANSRAINRYTTLAADSHRKQQAVSRGGKPVVAATWAERDAAKTVPSGGANNPAPPTATPTPAPDGEKP